MATFHVVVAWCIYCLTSPSGRKYIGQVGLRRDENAECAAKRRLKGHVKDARNRRGGGGCRVLAAAIQKYGADAFTYEVIEEVETQEQANEAEARWIARFNTQAPRGYNLDPGGGVAPRHPDTRRRMSARMKETLAAMTPEQRSERARKRDASMGAERLSDRARKANASRSLEQKQEAARKAASAFTPERRREIALKREAAKTPSWRSETARRANAARSPETRSETARKASAGLTSEERSALSRRWNAEHTPEQRLEIGRKISEARMRQTPEQRSEIARKANFAKTTEQRRKAWETRRARAEQPQ